MRVQELLEVCNELHCIRRSMCLLGKLYQWSINARKNSQEGSHDRRILKQTVLVLDSLPRKHQ